METLNNIKSDTWRSIAQYAATVYVLAWIVGLSTGAPSLTLQASGDEIISAFTTHQTQAAWQFILAEGLAGIALFITLWAAYKAHPSALRRKLAYVGSASSVISLIMCGLGVWLIFSIAPQGDVSYAKSIYDSINRIDGPKMWLLGAMGIIGFYLTRRHTLPHWHGIMGVIMAISLGIAGISYALLIDVLAPAVYVGGILLLVWVLSFGILVKRQANT